MFLQIIIILTDGNQTVKAGEDPRLAEAALPLKKKGIRIVTVGVGAVDEKQMKILAPDPRDRFTADRFEQLIPLVETMFSAGLCTGNKLILMFVSSILKSEFLQVMVCFISHKLDLLCPCFMFYFKQYIPLRHSRRASRKYNIFG